MDLVVDIGTTRAKFGLFHEGKLVERFVQTGESFSKEPLEKWLEGKNIEKTLISSVNPDVAEKIGSVMAGKNIRCDWLKASDFEKMLDVIDKQEVGTDRIANIYGALKHFPSNDCIAIDIGTAVSFDYVASQGRYLGGAIYLGAHLSAKALQEGTHQLPLIKIEKPKSPLGKTTVEHLQSGIYFGLLGAIERITFELRMTSDSPSSVSVIATGGLTEREEFSDDLLDFVDVVDPDLTLIGLHEILTERR